MGRRYRARARLGERKAVLKSVYILPNLFTTAAMFCGTLAMVRVFQQRLEPACWLILAAGVLDVFDGLVARLTHTESQFGLNYDSLSDLVTFGVSPAVLMMRFLSHGDAHLIYPYISISSILYMICGALRLARFGVQARGEESKSFTGLPIPAAAGTVISAFLVFQYYEGALLRVLPALMVLLGLLMVSRIPYPSLKSVHLKNRKPFAVLVVIVLFVVILSLLDDYIPQLLLGLFCFYICWGFVRWWRLRKMTSPPAPPTATTRSV